MVPAAKVSFLEINSKLFYSQPLPTFEKRTHIMHFQFFIMLYIRRFKHIRRLYVIQHVWEQLGVKTLACQ